MRTFLLLLGFLFVLVLMPSIVSAHSGNHTAREEKEGKAIWEKLQAKQVTCNKLSNESFEALGEYFMGQMVGSSHEAMNTMMEQMVEKVGEEQIHIVIGRRLSGCDTSAQIPQNGLGFMPMMWMMGSARSPQVGGGANSMMGFGNVMGWSGFGFFGFLTWIFWIVVLVDLILLGIWLWKKIKKEK